MHYEWCNRKAFPLSAMLCHDDATAICGQNLKRKSGLCSQGGGAYSLSLLYREMTANHL